MWNEEPHIWTTAKSPANGLYNDFRPAMSRPNAVAWGTTWQLHGSSTPTKGHYALVLITKSTSIFWLQSALFCCGRPAHTRIFVFHAYRSGGDFKGLANTRRWPFGLRCGSDEVTTSAHQTQQHMAACGKTSPKNQGEAKPLTRIVGRKTYMRCMSSQLPLWKGTVLVATTSTATPLRLTAWRQPTTNRLLRRPAWTWPCVMDIWEPQWSHWYTNGRMANTVSNAWRLTRAAAVRTNNLRSKGGGKKIPIATVDKINVTSGQERT